MNDSHEFIFFLFLFFSLFQFFLEYNKFENSSTHATPDTIYNRVNPLGCDNLVYKEVKCKHWYRNVEEEEEGGGGINVKQIIDLILSRLWNGIEENVSRESSLKADKLQGLGGKWDIASNRTMDPETSKTRGRRSNCSPTLLRNLITPSWNPPRKLN